MSRLRCENACEVDVICPKCGLIKDNVFFTISHETNRKKKTKRLLLAQKGQIFFQRKGFNLDILLIEQVISVYNAVNKFTACDKKNNKIYTLNFP